MKSMRNVGMLGALAALSLFAPSTHAYEHELWLKAQLRIGEDGQVQQLEWQGLGDTSRLITERLEPMIESWAFEPGRIDGAPAVTDTFLTLQVLGDEHDDGSVALSLGRVRTGALLATVTPPRFPMRDARNGNSAHLVATLDIAADGRITVADVKVEATRAGGGERFVEALKEVAVQWTPTLERVGGVPVATRMEIPVQFCGPGDMGWCAKFERERTERLRTQDVPSTPASEAIALDSAVKLLTPVRGQRI